MSEWDPWKRFERERERRYWDPWARYEYERDRLTWDPWYRIEKEMDRMSWDPYFRIEREVERRYSDPEYRFRLYEERRMSSDWFEVYLENSMDPILRDRREDLFRRNQISEDTRRVLDLFEAISRANQIYDRGLGFWLKLALQFGMLGFVGYLVYWLLTWRPPMP